MNIVDQILTQLAELIQLGRFKELETDGLEIKPVPADAGEWKEFDTFYRNVRNTFNKLHKSGFVEKVDGTSGYVLREDFKDLNILRKTMKTGRLACRATVSSTAG